MPGKSFTEMLVSGEIAAALTAHPPNCFLDRHPNIGRLFYDFMKVEKGYI